MYRSREDSSLASNLISVEVVNCDLCNPNTLNYLFNEQPAEGCVRGRKTYTMNEQRLHYLRRKAFPPEGFFVGSVKEAFDAGWREREYGVICPACIAQEEAQDQRDAEQSAESFVGIPGVGNGIDYDAEIEASSTRSGSAWKRRSRSIARKTPTRPKAPRASSSSGRPDRTRSASSFSTRSRSPSSPTCRPRARRRRREVDVAVRCGSGAGRQGTKNPNSDTLMMTEVLGHPVQFKEGAFQEGSLAAYIPVESMVPLAHPEFEFLKSPNHPERTHERIKAKRLRGVFSMGFLMPAPAGAAEGQDIAKDLGVYKYEEPEEKVHFEAPRPPGGGAST
jgi:hypothetical protein